MPQNTHVETICAEAERWPEPSPELAADLSDLRAEAAQLAAGLTSLPPSRCRRFFAQRCRALKKTLKPLWRALDAPLPKEAISDDFRWLHDNARLLYSTLQDVSDAARSLKPLPQARQRNGNQIPRALAVTEGFLAASAYRFDERSFAVYVDAYQETTALDFEELAALAFCLKLVLLERIAARAPQVLRERQTSCGVGECVHSLHDVGQISWKEVLEPLILFDRVLREDPQRAYARMDYDSRDVYRKAVAKIARHSRQTEMDVAIEALSLARDAWHRQYSDPRIAARRSHVGYYLVGRGSSLLKQRTNFRPSLKEKVRAFLLRHPDACYLIGIQLVTLAIMLTVLLGVIGPVGSPALVLLAMLALFLPSSQAAVEVMNYITTVLLPAQILPKLDFSEGIPEDCVTLVAVPALLLNERQVRKLVEDLEIRYLGNRDPNLHFALLTDLRDSAKQAPEDDPLVTLCAELIAKLNEKYSGQSTGSFLMLHRHRVYDEREGVWMGWERKRGKLQDLNQLLRRQHDSFPVKVGNTTILPQVRFVITLDSDTELPRGTAHRMVGALAHPLNRAIVDNRRNIVVSGYGILQPRVGVSVHSAARSRLANIYSGQTGLDIYTHAVSDVYQDLYGEAIFAGKGIYEVDTLHQVLNGRFPCNALLSHDLIEGAYARAGLASDIELIDDYPSHYSAYNRRKHRWLRGDWQVAGWLFSHVPDQTGARVPNPISLISRWKILDNLRRSLVEPATFLLLLLGWLVLPGRAMHWTLAAIAILFFPAWLECALNLLRALKNQRMEPARAALSGFVMQNVSLFLNLTFLAHQTLLSLDAIVRALVRRMVTGKRLLEWETAAEAELGAHRRTPVDVYLDWTSTLAFAVAVTVASIHPRALLAAIPVLGLWASSKRLSKWLNQPPRTCRCQVTPQDQLLLRRAALRTWRYFAEFSNEEHNWLIPDNVQETPARIAARISPTNLGFLLNARQVACEFGYLTVPEFAVLTQRTLQTVRKMPRYRGHLLNWYDTRTLAPLPPLFVSCVDSGNLMASLWTLQQGCQERLHRPVLERNLAQGFLDHLLVLGDAGGVPRRIASGLASVAHQEDWLERMLALPETIFDHLSQTEARESSADAQWFACELGRRLKSLKETARFYAPWMLPEFSCLRTDPALKLALSGKQLALERTPQFIEQLAERLRLAIEDTTVAPERRALYQALLAVLPEARAHALQLIRELESLANQAARLAEEMDFRLLLNKRRKLLSVGFDVESQELHSACYDLLATEARVAVFAAIAKEDIAQEAWFLLGRAHTLAYGRPVLISWTGTMFEYLMPGLWMRTYPNTLLERSRVAAVRSQQDYAARRHIPWGISESAYFQTDEAGNYQYHAFGLPRLALHKEELEALVISPYSTVLALGVDPCSSLQNLHKMAGQGWLGAYGFYEAADYTPSLQHPRRHSHEVVRCWMAHHQGMSFLAIANFLHGGVVRRWFHNNPYVQATELLLNEKPVAHVKKRAEYRSAAA
ncbi:MAG TPA: glucoamylase family protein [Terriglobales bacterium]|nr:glucoamylase family protein [Terriglobales bacterium]